jgi:hypothetical protein
MSVHFINQARFLSAKARTKRGWFKAKNIKGRLSVFRSVQNDEASFWLSIRRGNVFPELLQAAISDSCGDYHYHSVQREKTDSHAEKITSGHL